MKKIVVSAMALTLGLSGALFAAESSKGNAASLAESDKQSYAAGFAQGAQVGKMNKDLELDMKLDKFIQGFKDAYTTDKSALDNKETEKALLDLQKKIMEKQKAFLEKKFKDNKKKGSDFLAGVKKNNSKKVKELKDGILYEVLKSAKAGKSPTLKDAVVVSYTGKTIDGTIFDTSERGKDNNKATLNLKDLISGWKVALQNMRPGDKWKVYVPESQAYGDRALPGIDPYSTLVFEIELHDVVKSTKG